MYLHLIIQQAFRALLSANCAIMLAVDALANMQQQDCDGNKATSPGILTFLNSPFYIYRAQHRLPTNLPPHRLNTYESSQASSTSSQPAAITRGTTS